MNRKEKGKEGSITLEASIALTLFIFLILYLYSFFIVFQAQGKLAVALTRAADSMALDAYMVSKKNLGEVGLKNFPENISELLVRLSVGSVLVSPGQGKYVSTSNWVDDGSKEKLQEIIRQRLAAYLTKEGTKEEADKLLKKYRVEKGWNGLDFSYSHIDSNGNLKLVMQYKLKYLFDYPGFHVKPLEFRQRAMAHLWK